MARMEIAICPTDDRENVYLELSMDGEPLGHVYMTASEAEHHAHRVAENRSMLRDAVSRQLDPGSRLKTVINPAFQCERRKEGLLLALRHPGFGWLSFLIPHKEVPALGRWLVDRSKPVP